MILAALSSIVMLQAAAAPAAPDAALERLKARAEACIQSNAAVVERNDPNLTDAANFLTDHLCANEVQAVARYRMSAGLLAGMRNAGQFADADDGGEATPQTKAIMKKQFDMYRASRIDPDTGDIIYPPGSPAAMAAGWNIMAAQAAPAPEFRALAARAVLQARQSRTGQ